MKISIYAPYTKERFETAREHSILHPERIVGNLEVIPRNVGGRASIAAAKQFCQNIRHCASCAGPRQQQAFKNLSIRMVAGYREIAEIKEFLGCGGLQPSERTLNSLLFCNHPESHQTQQDGPNMSRRQFWQSQRLSSNAV